MRIGSNFHIVQTQTFMNRVKYPTPIVQTNISAQEKQTKNYGSNKIS